MIPRPPIAEDDWLYVCAVALKTQDVVQRKLLEIIAGLAGRAAQLPAFPLAERRTAK